MNSRIRIAAEARALYWPWVAVVCACLLAYFPDASDFGDLLQIASAVGFVIGIPLLGALPFGNEFQCGTFASLLGQPVERSSIWKEKLLVLFAAVVSAAAVHGLAWVLLDGSEALYLIALYLVLAAGSAAYWTLLARSTIGGLVLTSFSAIALCILVIWPWKEPPPRSFGFHLGVGATVAVVYATTLILWSLRKLTRFEATGGEFGGNLLGGPGSRSRAAVQSGRRTGMAGNLVSKELHLLRPVWLLTLLTVGLLLFATLVRLALGRERWMAQEGFTIVVLHGMLAAVLAGSLSLGEERASGTYIWNAVTPVSFRLQWFIKASLAVASSVASSAVVHSLADLAAGQPVWTEATTRVSEQIPIVVAVGVLTFVAFWCASAVKGTVRAVFWGIPITAVVLGGYAAGAGIGRSLRLNPLLERAVSTLHPFPLSNETGRFLARLSEGDLIGVAALCILGAVAAAGAVQSFRFLKTEDPGGFRSTLRPLLVLAGIAFGGGVIQFLPAAVANVVYLQTANALTEASQAVYVLKHDPRFSDRAESAISAENLSEVWPLSTQTRERLQGPLTIRPASGSMSVRLGARKYVDRRIDYSVTVNLQSGWTCTFPDRFFESPYRSYFLCRSDSRVSGYWDAPEVR